MTRQDYVDGFVTYEDYYESVATASGIVVDPEIAYEERFELANVHKDVIDQALTQHGDTWHLAAGVCTVLAAARLARRKKEHDERDR